MLAVFQLVKNTCSRLLQCLQHAAAMRLAFANHLSFLYTRRNGAEMSVSRICWDTGGIDPTIVYERSKKHGLFRVIPIKGASVYGKPVASMPRKRNKNGVYLTEIGTDIRCACMGV